LRTTFFLAAAGGETGSAATGGATGSDGGGAGSGAGAGAAGSGAGAAASGAGGASWAKAETGAKDSVPTRTPINAPAKNLERVRMRTLGFYEDQARLRTRHERLFSDFHRRNSLMLNFQRSSLHRPCHLVGKPGSKARRVVALTIALVGALNLASSPASVAAGSEDGPNPNTTAPGSAPKVTSAPTTSPVVSSPGSGAATPSAGAIDPAKDPSGAYEAGKAALASGDYKTAITVFTGVTAAQPKNADAWNLLGYATRKGGNPTASIPLYAKALALNPKHKGALEYQGEAYVQTNQMTKAKANLAALKKICGTKCEEYKDLAGFIAAKGKSSK
jgi:tetratricopeptide (TPR) repeat protein